MGDEKQKESLGKIYKHNPLLLASLEVNSSNSRNELNNNDILVFNYILKLCQEQIRQKLFINKGLLNFSIGIEDFAKLFPNNPNWVREIISSLKRLFNTAVTFKNVKIPKCLASPEDEMPNTLFSNELSENDYEEFFEYSCHLISSLSKPKNKKDVVNFSIHPIIAYCAWTKTNYTHISLDKMFVLKSKYAQKIYEFIEYYVGLHKKKNDEIISISIGKKELKNLFKFDDDLPFSTKIQRINRNNILERDMNKIYEDFNIEKRKNELVITLKYPKNL
ncbi:hypothetical protein CQA57_06945 [Helicobacter anseris]|uniref:Initiator Rep protein WH1 domain-containing protein n=1 Tax=Helicobacter anseris TaxID=375926 RepID=A0A3D8J491_9HELI|nr:RepB family plasmid replication initiator protein [Helicobacter anseris]RDU72332.1 hypothetical protein CQA57_06945 [Helicobacter anseris]